MDKRISVGVDVCGYFVFAVKRNDDLLSGIDGFISHHIIIVAKKLDRRSSVQRSYRKESLPLSHRMYDIRLKYDKRLTDG